LYKFKLLKETFLNRVLIGEEEKVKKQSFNLKKHAFFFSQIK